MKTWVRLRDWMTRSPARLYLLFALLAVLPIGLFAYSASRVLSREAEAQGAEQILQIAQLSARLIEEHFRQSTSFLESFAERPSFRRAWSQRDWGAASRHLQRAYRLRPDFAFLSLYEADGTLRQTFPPEPGLLNHNFSSQDWYQGVSHTWTTYVSEVYEPRRKPAKPVVAIAVPLKDDRGRPVGVFVATTALEVIRGGIQPSTHDQQWTISIVDHHGHLLADPGVGASLQMAPSTGFEPMQRLQAGEQGVGLFGRGEEEVLVAYIPIRPYGWGVLAEEPADVVRQAAGVLTRQIWLLGLVFVALALACGGMVGSLYQRLETGNRFFQLSVDLLCIAGFDGYFKQLNPAWEKVLGYRLEELLARPYLDFVHPDDRHATGAEAEKLAAGDLTQSFENRYCSKDGSYRWLLWRALPLPDQQLIFAVARDITERKQTEEEIQALNRILEERNVHLQAVNAELETFTYSVSHDLRAPLRHLDGFSRILVEEFGAELNPTAQRYLQRIREGTAQMGELVDDLLSLSRVGRHSLRHQRTALDSLVDQARAELEPEVGGREIEWRIGRLPTVDCDPNLMKQVFANLLSNAVKFTRPCPRAVIQIDQAVRDGQPVVFVRDNGVGFDMKYSDKLFGVFQRLHPQDDFEGTGVGLATVQRIIHRHGGRIWAEAALGEGATFYFTLAPSPEGSANSHVSAAAGREH